MSTKIKRFPFQGTVAVIMGLVVAGAAVDARGERVTASWEVDRIWSVHPSSPPILMTTDSHQYLAYYDATRRLTLAWRSLAEDTWNHRHFPVVTTWATRGHALIGLAVDADGIIHLVPYRRSLSEAPQEPPHIIYYRSTAPHDPESMERAYMVSPDEPAPHYPRFHVASDGGLFFECRIGSSGAGDQKWYRHDSVSGLWESMGVLLDGRGRMNAYARLRQSGDGRWHYLWMWRNSPEADSNHSLSYIYSDDLVTWRSACGTELDPPVNIDEKRVLIDPAPPGGGLINPVQNLGFDSRDRAIATYHAYAPCGRSAIFNARFEDGRWRRVEAKIWKFRWDFGGRGAIDVPLGAGPVIAAGGGRLLQKVWSRDGGEEFLVLDEGTLESRGATRHPDALAMLDDPSWKRRFSAPEIDFPHRPMQVHWRDDAGNPPGPGVRYVIRWETGPVNLGDRPVPKPWPEPAPLRVFQVRE